MYGLQFIGDRVPFAAFPIKHSRLFNYGFRGRQVSESKRFLATFDLFSRGPSAPVTEAPLRGSAIEQSMQRETTRTSDAFVRRLNRVVKVDGRNLTKRSWIISYFLLLRWQPRGYCLP